ncbi:MAG: DUF1592 domain-containing protein [Planctomycetaceae bacterium]|nr:DUF1592 domain-containing protein [Planctomycetaceae bacterium]
MNESHVDEPSRLTVATVEPAQHNTPLVRTAARRLTRTEYCNCVRDLLHLSSDFCEELSRILPPDPQIEGFDKRAESLMLERAQLDAYISAALQIADHAIISGDTQNPPVPTQRVRFEFEDTPVHPYEVTMRPWAELVPEGLILMSGSVGTRRSLRRDDFNKMVPVTGRYAVRIRAAVDQRSSNERILLRLWRPEIGTTLLETFVDAPLETPKTYEVVLPLETAGADGLVAIFVNGTNFGQANLLHMEMNAEVERLLSEGKAQEAARLRAQMRAEGVIASSRPNPLTTTTAALPRLFLDWVEIEGPLYESWPPQSHQTIFASPQGDVADREYVHSIFRRLLPVAWRRSVDVQDIDEVVTVVERELDAGEPLTEAVKVGLATMLTSPSFLFLGTTHGESFSTLEELELAERLSFFLWSSLPDEQLLSAARAGLLGSTDELTVQTLRMLEDNRSEALVMDFARQWLKVDEFDRFPPDVEVYPAFDRPENASLQEDFKKEALEFFREVLRSDQPIADFLNCRWTMLNERLAEYYGIPDVSGPVFRRVVLPAESPRGGLLGMAGLHRWGSDGNRTRPVHRGVYVLDVLFNERPQLPPPDAGELEANVVGENLTVRERLAAHRDVEGCAECHIQIDGYGLALENFNAVGQWREVQDGETRNWSARGGAPSIDASGTLHDGRKYSDYSEFKQLLLADEDRFIRALAEKLLAYSTGRRLESEDAESVSSAVNYANQNGRTLRALITGIVRSKSFQSR